MTSKKGGRICIIGGGIAGLYTAWRILEDGDPSLRVEIFEASASFGGRIKSQAIPWIPFKAELGAMRFRSNHLLLRSLLDELSIHVRNFDVKPPSLRVRGRTLSIKELTKGGCSHCGASIPYLLKPEERGKSPEELVIGVIGTLLENLTFPSLGHTKGHGVKQKIAEGDLSAGLWKAIKEAGQYNNTPLYNIGFWNLLQHYLSNEAFQLVHDALSLESVLGNWSAAEAIPWFLKDFASQELYMVPEGMAAVIKKLEARISQPKYKDRVSAHLESPVTECLRGENSWLITYKGNGKPQEFDKVILALPQHALKELVINKKKGERWKPKWIDWVHPHRLFKLFLLYENEWWMQDDLPGHAVGRIFTDLPLRQIYYFPPKWMEKCGKNTLKEFKGHDDVEDALARWSLVMASYSDEHYVSFWNPPLSVQELGMYERPSLYYKQPEHLPASFAEKIEKKFNDEIPRPLRASERIVKKVQHQLSEIHGHIVPDPIIGVFKDWGEAPFGGGWHTWKIGAKPWSGRDGESSDMLADLYLCGEAYSTEQGWIEGALKSSEVVLKQLEIAEPQWNKARRIEDFYNYIIT